MYEAIIYIKCPNDTIAQDVCDTVANMVTALSQGQLEVDTCVEKSKED